MAECKCKSTDQVVELKADNLVKSAQIAQLEDAVKGLKGRCEVLEAIAAMYDEIVDGQQTTISELRGQIKAYKEMFK